MSSVKSLQGKLEKLTARIKTQQENLAKLKNEQKDLKSRLAEAKATAKANKAAGS
ncbi:MAG: hypothetical protein IT429_24760 [Gemmataceae bacterium]|nr:hypothetical protein [Gemmataceae bacterium]